MKTAVVVSTCLLGAFAAPASNLAQRDTQQTAGLLQPISGVAGAVPVIGPLLAGILNSLDGLTDKLPVAGLTQGLGGTLGTVVSTAGDAVKGVPAVGGTLGGVSNAVGDAVKGATEALPVKRAEQDAQVVVSKLVDLGYDQKYAEGITDALSALLKSVPGIGSTLAQLADTLTATVKGATGAVPVLGDITKTVL